MGDGKKLIKKRARSFAPGTVSNVGPGFDLMGFPVFGIGDEVEVIPNGTGTSRIVAIQGNDAISHEVESNTAGKAILSFLEENAPGEGVDITLYKNMPIGSGMGSSAASAVAGVVAVNGLLAEPLKTDQLVEYAMAGEMIASGSRHGDNVIPSLVGGFVIINDIETLDFFRVDAPADLLVMLIHPHIEIKTSHARSILPDTIPVKDSIRQTSAALTLLAGIVSADYAKIAAASKDYIAEPYRSGLIPGYAEAKRLLLAGGAVAFNISGSGPTMFALFNDAAKAETARSTVEKIHGRINLGVDISISKVNNGGAKLLEVE